MLRETGELQAGYRVLLQLESMLGANQVGQGTEMEKGAGLGGWSGDLSAGDT